MDFIPEMMELYPDAKVVLVKRDAVKWWNSIAALTSRTTPVWLGPLMAPIPGWRHLPSFANEYSRSMLSLIGLTEDTASPVELLKKGGPRKLFSLFPFPPHLNTPLTARRGKLQISLKRIVTKFGRWCQRASCLRWR